MRWASASRLADCSANREPTHVDEGHKHHNQLAVTPAGDQIELLSAGDCIFGKTRRSSRCRYTSSVSIRWWGERSSSETDAFCRARFSTCGVRHPRHSSSRLRQRQIKRQVLAHEWGHFKSGQWDSSGGGFSKNSPV